MNMNIKVASKSKKWIDNKMDELTKNGYRINKADIYIEIIDMNDDLVALYNTKYNKLVSSINLN